MTSYSTVIHDIISVVEINNILGGDGGLTRFLYDSIFIDDTYNMAKPTYIVRELSDIIYADDNMYNSMQGISFNLVVSNGFGGGLYKRDDIVNITPNIGAQEVFIMWAGDIQYVEDYFKAQTKVSMPASHIVVRALTKRLTEVSSLGAAQHDIIIEQGATFSMQLIWKNAGGEVTDLSQFTSARMKVKEHKSDVSYAVSLIQGSGITLQDDGIVLVTIDEATTSGITINRGYYDLEVEDSTGTVYRLAEGKVKIIPNVTN